MQDITIEWSKAIQQAKENEAKREIEKTHYLQDYLEGSFEMLDAADLHFYAEMTGIEANELRRMHPQSKTMQMYVDSFINDDTDDIINFF